MKRLTLTALALSAMAAPAFAQSADAPLDRSQMILADEIDGNVFARAEGDVDWPETLVMGNIGDNWEDVGDIDDVVLDPSGRMIGVRAEIGGFLGLGDRDVFLRLENVRLVANPAKGSDEVGEGRYSIVTNMTKDQLKALPEIEQSWWDKF